MSKHTYRATAFQQLDWDDLKRQAGGSRLVLAIDVAKADFVATLMQPSQHRLATLKWTHPQDTRAFVGRIESLATPVEVVMEPTGTYGDAVRYRLRAAGFPIYRIAGKRVADAKELYDGVASLHDGKSAYILARLHLEGISSVWSEPDDRRRILHAYSNELADYSQRWQRARNRLEALLARSWPEYEQIMNLRLVSGLRLLAHYGTPDAVTADAQTARAHLRQASHGRLAPDTIDSLITSATTTVGVPLLPVEAEQVQRLASEVLDMQAQCRRLERQLRAYTQADSGLARQAEAVGVTTAIVLYAVLGDPRAYPHAGSYAKAAGLHLKEHSSGKHKGQLGLTKRGPSIARFYLYFAALRLLPRNGPARRWYDAKVARDGGRAKKASGALMRKLIKALWYVGQGAAFDETLLFDDSAFRQAA